MPATVLVNTVSDADVAAQHAAALAALGHNYSSLATVQPNTPEQHAWYVSQHTHASNRSEVYWTRPTEVEAGTPDAVREVADGGSPQASVAPQRSWVIRQGADHSGSDAELDGDAARVLAGDAFRENRSGEEEEEEGVGARRGDRGRRERSTTAHGRGPPALMVNDVYPEELHAMDAQLGNSIPAGSVPTHVPVSANPIPLGAAHLNPLSPMRLQFHPRSEQATLSPTSAAMHSHGHLNGSGGSSSPPSSSSRFRFLPPWGRSNRRRSSSSPTRNSAAASEMLAGVVEGCCFDEQGNPLTVQQAEDVYGTSQYLPRPDPVVVLVAVEGEDTKGRDDEEEEDTVTKHDLSSASVFSFYQFSSGDHCDGT